MTIDFSQYEINDTLAVNGQRTETWTNEKMTDYPQVANKVLVMRRQAENPNPYIPQHFTILTATNPRTLKIGTAMVTLRIEWSQSFSSPSTTC